MQDEKRSVFEMVAGIFISVSFTIPFVAAVILAADSTYADAKTVGAFFAWFNLIPCILTVLLSEEHQETALFAGLSSIAAAVAITLGTSQNVYLIAILFSFITHEAKTIICT